MRISRAVTFCFSALTLPFAVEASAAPIGLVLSGGGARGAYEVGVWQALQVAGLASNVAAISGTSVGGLNAALFATRPDAAEQIWLEKMKDIFSINTNRVGESIQKTLDDASRAMEVAEETGEDWKGVASLAGNILLRGVDYYVKIKQSRESCVGYIDSTKLDVALKETLPVEWRATAPAVYATAVEKGGSGVSKTWRLNSEPHERRVLMLRASAAFPVGFDTVLIDGVPYVDGGWEAEGGNNVPLKPILENHPEIKTVVVVYLKDKKHLDVNRRIKNRKMAFEADVRLVEIIPSEDIGGLLGIGGLVDTSPETARRLIELGKKDAMAVLKKEGLLPKTS